MLQEKLIDYGILSKACEYYAARGFRQIEVPWVVSETVAKSTFSGEEDSSYVLTNGGYLVGSAEQGFVHMMQAGKLEPEVRYFAVSPCFRGDVPDGTHSNWFMKLELFVFTNSGYDFFTHGRLEEYFISCANTFFIEQIGIQDRRGVHLFTSCTELGYDILVRRGYGPDAEELELGSYGNRKIGEKTIVYGTGVALPRLTLAIEAHKQMGEQDGRVP